MIWLPIVSIWTYLGVYMGKLWNKGIVRNRVQIVANFQN